MEREKCPIPQAICTRCNEIHPARSINTKCYKTKGCKGIVRSMLHKNNWKECPDCNATGEKDDIMCRTCKGNGWLYRKV